MIVLLTMVGAAGYALLRFLVLRRKLTPDEFADEVLRRPTYWYFLGVMLAIAAVGGAIAEPTAREAPVLGITAHALAAGIYAAWFDRAHLSRERPRSLKDLVA